MQKNNRIQIKSERLEVIIILEKKYNFISNFENYIMKNLDNYLKYGNIDNKIKFSNWLTNMFKLYILDKECDGRHSFIDTGLLFYSTTIHYT